MILIVTYDLKAPAGSYDALYATLKKQGTWWHYLPSTWLLATSKNPGAVFEELKPHLKTQPMGGDFILVAELGPRHSGWLPKDAWEWINKHSSQPS